MNWADLQEPGVQASGRVIAPDAAPWERTYAMFMHLTLALVHAFPVPVVPALVLWLIKRHESPFIDDHGREALNFQISLLIYALCLVPIGLLTCGVGVILFLPLYALGIVGLVLGAVAAHRGEYFRYPMTCRFFT